MSTSKTKSDEKAAPKSKKKVTAAEITPGVETVEKAAPPKTRLAKRYENETAKAYENIRAGIKIAVESLAVAKKEFESKSEPTELEKKVFERDLAKYAKLAVWQIEKKNLLHIFEFKSTTGGWWKIGGNSVAIHRLMVGSYLDRDININLDRDSFSNFKEGVICLQNEFRLERDIAYSGAGMELDETIDFGPFKEYIRAYRLNQPVTAAEVHRFKKTNEEILKNINNNIFAVSPDVEVNNHIAAVLRASYRVERMLDSSARGYIGHSLLNSVFDMRRAYYDVANTRTRDPARIEAYGRLISSIGDAMTTIANYADLDIAKREALAGVSLELAKVRELCQQKINKSSQHQEIIDKLKENAEKHEKAAPAPASTAPAPDQTPAPAGPAASTGPAASAAPAQTPASAPASA